MLKNSCPERLAQLKQANPNVVRCFSALRPQKLHHVQNLALWHCLRLRKPLPCALPNVLPQHLLVDPATFALLVDKTFTPLVDVSGRVHSVQVRDTSFADVVDIPNWMFNRSR